MGLAHRKYFFKLLLLWSLLLLLTLSLSLYQQLWFLSHSSSYVVINVQHTKPKALLWRLNAIAYVEVFNWLKILYIIYRKYYCHCCGTGWKYLIGSTAMSVSYKYLSLKSDRANEWFKELFSSMFSFFCYFFSFYSFVKIHSWIWNRKCPNLRFGPGECV